MRPRNPQHERFRVAVLAGIGAVLLLATVVPPSAAELQGSYVGSFVRTEGPNEGNTTQHRYDVGTFSTSPGGLDLFLRGSFTFQAEPGESNTELLRSRFYGDVRSANLWRLWTQWAPWQDVTPGADPSRERVLQLGLDLTPPRVPQLRIDINRLDRETPNGPSLSDDRRARVGYQAGDFSTGLGFRRVETEYGGRIGGSAKTKEWRGDAAWAKSVGWVTTRAAYDALYSTYRSAAREQDYYTQRGDLSLFARPHRRVSLSGDATVRWGKSEDNNPPETRLVDERSYSGRVEYRPVEGMSLSASRDYRRSQGATEDLISDFARVQALFGRRLARNLNLQTGYLRSFDVGSRVAQPPANSVYALVDGAVRRGIEGRGELRLSRSGDGIDTGDQWRRLLQLRTFPRRYLRAQLTWRKDTLPIVQGQSQTDREWELVLGWQPSGNVDIVNSWRRLDGSGRLDRQERFGSLSASWRTRQSTLFSLNWSRRVAQTGLSRSDQSIWGGDVTFRVSGDFRTKFSWTRVSDLETDDRSTYGLLVEKTF